MTDEGRSLLKEKHVTLESDAEDLETTQDDLPPQVKSAVFPLKKTAKTVVNVSTPLVDELPVDFKWIVEWFKPRPDAWKWFKVPSNKLQTNLCRV
jgi:hypothetical protein